MAAGGPAIVATQVVSDYLTSYDSLYMQVSAYKVTVVMSIESNKEAPHLL